MTAFFEKLMRIDKRIIYVIMLLSMTLPMFMTFGLPIRLSQPTLDAYDIIEALNEGDIVWIGAEVSPSQESELAPMMKAMARHLCEKKARILIGGFFSQGPDLAKKWIYSILDEYGYVEGVDFVNVGYRTSFAATMDAARMNLHEAFANRDVNNTPFSDLPLMADVKVAADVDLVIAFDGGSPGTDDYIASWQATGDVMTMIGAVAAVEIPNNMVKYNAGLLKGLAGGMSGAAQYEKLVEAPGAATSGMDSQGFAHLTIIAFIILGNIGYLVTRSSGRKADAENLR